MDAVGLGKGLVTNASTGLANATAGANNIAAQQLRQGNSTAAGIGGLVSGIGGVIQKSGLFSGGGANPEAYTANPTFNNVGEAPTIQQAPDMPQ
jgi:hypothetical protein